jgi:serine/threonine protein kinase
MSDQGFELFGQYFLLDRIAYGGMAAIYLARPATLAANGRVLVVKRILPHVAEEPEFRKMFRSEIQVCLGFSHLNLVQLYDFGEHDRQPYIAMEYVEGKNLREITQKHAKLDQKVPIGLTVSAIAQAAAGLHYAHTFRNRVTGEELKVIHRDVSPQNILMSYDGNVKLIDFGIAKADVENGDVTRTGSIKGKVSYLSPEQLLGQDLDARSDVFSLGCVLWEMLTGQKLFHLLGKSDLEVMDLIRNCEKYVKPPSVLNPEVTAELDQITLKALAKDRDARFASAEEFQKALRGFILTRMPGYGYSDVGQAMKQIFREERIEERMYIKTLNDQAQKLLSDDQATKPNIPVPPQRILSTQVPRLVGHSDPSIPIAPPAVPQVAASPNPVHVHLPPPVVNQLAPMDPEKGQFYVKLTPGRMLALIIYVVTVVGLRMDRDYLFLEQLLPAKSRISREASLDPLESAEVVAQARLIRAAKRNREAAEKKLAPARSVRLRISVSPRPDSRTSIIVNEIRVDSRNPVVAVPVDRKFSVKVERPDFRTYENQMLLTSASLRDRGDAQLQIDLSRAAPAAGKRTRKE